MTKEDAIRSLRDLAVRHPHYAGLCRGIIALIEQQAKEAETNVLNICQQQHTIAEQAKEIEELKMYSKLDADILEESKKETQTLHTQNERLAKEIEGLKEKCAYMAKYKVYEEVTTLHTQNERLVRLLSLALDGALTLETTMEAKALLAATSPAKTAGIVPTSQP